MSTKSHSPIANHQSVWVFLPSWLQIVWGFLHLNGFLCTTWCLVWTGNQFICESNILMPQLFPVSFLQIKKCWHFHWWLCALIHGNRVYFWKNCVKSLLLPISRYHGVNYESHFMCQSNRGELYGDKPPWLSPKRIELLKEAVSDTWLGSYAAQIKRVFALAWNRWYITPEIASWGGDQQSKSVAWQGGRLPPAAGSRLKALHIGRYLRNCPRPPPAPIHKLQRRWEPLIHRQCTQHQAERTVQRQQTLQSGGHSSGSSSTEQNKETTQNTAL